MNKRFTPPTRKQFYQIDLTGRTKQILLGGILGHGSLKIAKRYKNARYCLHHSIKQKAYLNWKFNALEPELKGKLSVSLANAKRFSAHKKIIYQSRVSSSLTQLHHLTHQNNQKTIKRRWLNNLDALALAVWWCDDGSLNAHTRQGVFCSDGFSYEEHTILARYLQTDWHIYCTIIKHKKPLGYAYRLQLDRKNLDSFLTLILPHIPVASMLYKVMPCYDNLENQQRWISKVQTSLPQFYQQLETYYMQPLNGYAFHKNFVSFFMASRKVARLALENDIVQ